LPPTIILITTPPRRFALRVPKEIEGLFVRVLEPVPFRAQRDLPGAVPWGRATRSTGEFSNGTSAENCSGILGHQGRPCAHAILILDQAGRHGAKELGIPGNISLSAAALALTRTQQPRGYLAIDAPELAREPRFDCCFAWSTLVEQPRTIMSIGLRDWASVGQSF
jgi:hypothetical protein